MSAFAGFRLNADSSFSTPLPAVINAYGPISGYIKRCLQELRIKNRGKKPRGQYRTSTIAIAPVAR